MSRILALILPFLILAILGFGGVAVLNALAPQPEEAEEAPAGLSVFAAPIVEGSLDLTVRTQGEVEPKREIVLAPQIAGRIAYVSPDFIDGGFIREGQVLVRLEATDYELAVVRAQSIVAAAEQRLAREVAEAELAREDLADLGITESSPLARREPQLAEARASLDSAMAQLRDAELGLERTAVRAPFDGRVRERTADFGQFVSPGATLGRIFATDVVEVALAVTDGELGRIGLPLAFAATADNPGPPVIFRAEVAGRTRNWEGQVTRTAAAFDPRTRLINVIAELEDPYGTGADEGAPMAPGLFVEANVQGTRLDNLLIAPRSALRGEDEIYIGNPRTGILSVRKVDVVFTNREGAYLRSGVEPGELAVVSPIQAAFDGMRIKVVERRPDGSLITHEPDPPAVADTGAVAASGAPANREGAIQ